MKDAKQKLENLKIEFKSFDAQLLSSILEGTSKELKIVYSSNLIEHLSALYYELGDYVKPIIYSSKPKGENHVETYYDKNGRAVKAIEYNFNKIILSHYYFVYSEDVIKCYEINDNKLIKLEVLVLKNGQKMEYYRYCPFGSIDEVHQYVYKSNTLVAIKAFSASYICNQETEYKIGYKDNKLSEIIRVDEKSEIFPNGQTLKIFPWK